jgi:hypothetical protein
LSGRLFFQVRTRTLAAAFLSGHGSDPGEIEAREPIDLVPAVAATEHQQAQALTLDELVKAWSTVVLEGSRHAAAEMVAAFGSISTWDITSPQLE